MSVDQQFSEIAGLIGEQSRAMMLWHLMEGRALTATELAICADVSPQSASMHLNKLVSAGILTVEKQGRHRYFRFSTAEAAHAVEAIAGLLPQQAREGRSDSRDLDGIRYCRTCYDHLAGRVGVQIIERLLKRRFIVLHGAQFELTAKGAQWFRTLGIEAAALKSSRRMFAKACLDWSERRHHLAGALGAALLDSMVRFDWIRRVQYSRSVVVTSKGRQKLYDLLELNL